MNWNNKSWIERAVIVSLAWLLTVGACGGGIMLILRNSLSEGERYEVKSVFLSLAGAGVCALWLAYWMGRKSMPFKTASRKTTK